MYLEITNYANFVDILICSYDRTAITYLLTGSYEFQGHRAELYAARVAKCLAALEGRDKVYVDDLKKAVSILLNYNA